MKKVFCPQCKKEHRKSRVYVGMSTTTCMYFQPSYDEDGEYHHHDGNTTSTLYSCSNGHQWVVDSRSECPNPNCDWGKYD